MAFLTDFADEPELQEVIERTASQPSLLTGVPTSVASPEELGAAAQSIDQGRRLDTRTAAIGITRNIRFMQVGGAFVRAGSPFTMDGLAVTVLAPNDDLLAQLKKTWKAELKKLLKKEVAASAASVQALAASFDDPSVPNQSSIVLLVSFAQKRMLLTGDVSGDHLIGAIEDRSDVLGPTPLHVDLFKVPHHGSAHSNGPELFAAVTADHYVISGDGEHGNPHPDALTALFASAQGRPITLHLTNRPTDGATKPDDVAKAQRAQEILDAAASDPNVTIHYRTSGSTAVSVRLR
jgi:hypothetical protein